MSRSVARGIAGRAMPIRIEMGRRLTFTLDSMKNSSRVILLHPQAARDLPSRLTSHRALLIGSQGASRVASCVAGCGRQAGMTSVTSGQGAQSFWCVLGAHRAGRSIWRLTVATAKLLRHIPFAGGIGDRSRLAQGGADFGLIDAGPAS